MESLEGKLTLMDEQKQAELEALLFIYGEPITLKRISKFIGLSESATKSLIEEYQQYLNDTPERGLTLVQNNDQIQLVTKPQFQAIARQLIKEEFRENLTPASLETLSIISYLGPMPRSTIDQIRGVNASFILRSLLVRGLIEREPNPKQKNIYLYRISMDFLKHLGLQKKEDLPNYQDYKDILERFELVNYE